MILTKGRIHAISLLINMGASLPVFDTVRAVSTSNNPEVIAWIMSVVEHQEFYDILNTLIDDHDSSINTSALINAGVDARWLFATAIYYDLCRIVTDIIIIYAVKGSYHGDYSDLYNIFEYIAVGQDKEMHIKLGNCIGKKLTITTCILYHS